MNREYHKWFSPSLGRDMELTVFGHAGLPAIVFPTSGGRFFEFEDRGLVHSLAGKLDRGDLQLYCVESVDLESWYNRNVPPRWRIARQLQFEAYILKEVLPLVRQRNSDPHLVTLGCSLGGYHAVNIAMRHPDLFTGFLSMCAAFDITRFLHGYYDEDVYFNTPPHYLPNMSDPWFFDRYRQNTYILASGYDDHCLPDNQRLAEIFSRKEIPCRFDIWSTWNSHDWPTWEKMLHVYL